MVTALGYGNLFLLMSYLKYSSYFFVFVLFFKCTLVYGQEPLFGELKKNRSNLLDRYLRIHQKFTKKMCSGGKENKFWELNKKFRGYGNYIPVLNGGEVDTESIIETLKIIEEKINWLKGIKKKIKTERLGNHLREIKVLEKKLSVSIDLKSKWLLKGGGHYGALSSYNDIYRKDLLKFINKLYFLHDFRFPIDHLELRRMYDDLKKREDLEGKRAANKIYFYRQIVEDGAQDSNHSRSDLYLRSLMSSLRLELSRDPKILEQDFIRYDLTDFFKWTRNLLSRGKRKQIERINEWLDRTRRSHKLYLSLVDKNSNQKKYFLKKAQHRKNLKDFVLKEQVATYDFWSRQPEIIRALFAIETILFNEVGRVDVPGHLERRDVAQVVINRRFLKEYSHFGDKDHILNHFSDKKKKELKHYPWLNVLFKQGEFSFTYFFISGNVRLYCPDMSRRGRVLRKENIRIGIDALKRPKFNFDAVRYFSRGSMVGRVSMNTLWKNYERISERPGIKIKQVKKYKRGILKGQAKLLYRFDSNDRNSPYHAYLFQKKLFVANNNHSQYFYYRNPHHFSYFKAKSEEK